MTPPLVSSRNDVWEAGADLGSASDWLKKGFQPEHCTDLGSNASSVWNFCARFSDITSCGNNLWSREMLAVFLENNYEDEI